MNIERFDLPAIFVDSPDSLVSALSDVFDAELLSVDAEFSLTGTHYCVLALLQVATHDRVLLIDPLAIPKLIRPLLEALAVVPWIVHDYSGDGIVYKRLYDVVPNTVMDTMMLAKALGYAQPGLKTMAWLKLGVNIPKQEQDSNWMLRPLRDSQLAYAARDAALLLPLLRELADEAKARRIREPETDECLKQLPNQLKQMVERVKNYVPPNDPPLLEKIKAMGLGNVAFLRAKKLLELRHKWGNEGDIAAVMELGNRWIISRVQFPPKTIEALGRTIPNPRFKSKHLDLIWDLFSKT